MGIIIGLVYLIFHMAGEGSPSIAIDISDPHVAQCNKKNIFIV